MQRQWHFADFIEKQRAALGVGEQTFAVPRRAGKGAFQVAEEFRLDHVGGDGSTIDWDERLVDAIRQGMNGARGHFLAGAGFSGDQDGGRQRGNARNGIAHLLDLRGMADQLVAQQRMVGGRLQLVPQHVVFPLQTHPIEAARDRVQDLVGTERLQDKVHCACAQCVDGRFQIDISCHQDGMGEETDPALFGQPFDAVLARHDVVEDDDVKVMRIELGRRLDGISRFLKMLAARTKRTTQKVAHAWLVVDDENGGLCQPRTEFGLLRHLKRRARCLNTHSPLPVSSKRFCVELPGIAGKAKKHHSTPNFAEERRWIKGEGTQGKFPQIGLAYLPSLSGSEPRPEPGVERRAGWDIMDMSASLDPIQIACI